MKFNNILYDSVKDKDGKFYFESSKTRTVDKGLQIKKVNDFKKKLKKARTDIYYYFGLRDRYTYTEFLKNKEYQTASFEVLEDLERAIADANFKRDELREELYRTRRDLRDLISLIKDGQVVTSLDSIRVSDFYKRCNDEISKRTIVYLDNKLKKIK